MNHEAALLMSDGVGAADELIGLVSGGVFVQALCAFAELGAPDLLSEAPMRVEELASALKCDRGSLGRLLCALEKHRFCTQTPDGSFHLTKLGSLLRSGAPGSLRDWVLWYGKNQWQLWSKLTHSIMTGRSARIAAEGIDGLDYLDRDPKRAQAFNNAMLQLSSAAARCIVETIEFGSSARVIDVGGGYGALLGCALETHPDLTGILFDRPHAVRGAKRHLAHMGVAARCEFIEGDFFKTVPSGADAYLLKSIVHDWDDERALKILRSCRRAMADGAKLLLIERVAGARHANPADERIIAASDLNMLVGPGGQERTWAEYRSLLESAGFALLSQRRAGLGYSVLEARPA
jgi:orsellinic acid C2-O-methyltransferase